MTIIKERPILFTASMVRAILDGRKTMTRRIIKPQPTYDGIWFKWDGHRPNSKYGAYSSNTLEDLDLFMGDGSPYGKVGDRLWVRETFYAWGGWVTQFDAKKGRDAWSFEDLTHENCREYQYEDCSPPFLKSGMDGVVGWRKRPSIFMPRKASRLTLEITAVRVQRLQDITPEDAIAEGLACLSKDGGKTYKYGIPDLDGLPGTDNIGWAWEDWSADPVAAYRRLWELINGEGSWDLNPWVWVVSFKQVNP